MGEMSRQNRGISPSAGCGVGHSPVASQDEAAILPEASAGVLVFSTGEPVQAAKKAKGVKRTGKR